MKTAQIKTIDIQAKEWFDKVNGNSYFSAEVTINYGMKNQVNFYIPMNYGYGDSYRYKAFEEIKKRLNCFKKFDDRTVFWKVYEDCKITARHSKVESNKRDL